LASYAARNCEHIDNKVLEANEMSGAVEHDQLNPLSPPTEPLGENPGHHVRPPPRHLGEGASEHFGLPPDPFGENPGHHVRPPLEELASVFRDHTAAMDRLTDALKKSSFSEDLATRLAALEAKASAPTG